MHVTHTARIDTREMVARYASIRYVSHVQADGFTIRRRREQTGYGLRKFAVVAHMSPAYLSRIERGQRNPQPEVLARIAHALGCAIEDLEQKEKS